VRVEADKTSRDNEVVFRKLRGDFDQAGVKLADDELRQAMHETLAQAVEQIEAKN
jgi:hypothetical protein